MPSHSAPSSAVAGTTGQSSANAASAAAPAETAKSPAYKAYQSDIIDGALQDYTSKSKEIGGPVAEHVRVLVRDLIRFAILMPRYLATGWLDRCALFCSAVPHRDGFVLR